MTALLEKAGNRAVEIQGKRIAAKRFLAAAIWQGVATGRIPLTDGTVLELAPKDWVAFVQWLYQHIDGTKQHSEVTGKDGQPMELAIVERITRAGD